MSGVIPSFTLPYSLAQTAAGNWLALAFWQGKVVGTGSGTDPAKALRDAHVDVAINLDLPVGMFILIDALNYRCRQLTHH